MVLKGGSIMKVNIKKLSRGSWISNSCGIYEVVKIYEAAGGTFVTVKEVCINSEDGDLFTYTEEHDMTPADIKSCDMVSY